MLPSKKELDQSVEENYKEIFKGIKLSKKAEKKVKELIITNIAFGYKISTTSKLHNELVKLASTTAKVLNRNGEVYNHKFEDVVSNEVLNESEDKEVIEENSNA